MPVTGSSSSLVRRRTPPAALSPSSGPWPSIGAPPGSLRSCGSASMQAMPSAMARVTSAKRSTSQPGSPARQKAARSSRAPPRSASRTRRPTGRLVRTSAQGRLVAGRGGRSRLVMDGSGPPAATGRRNRTRRRTSQRTNTTASRLETSAMPIASGRRPRRGSVTVRALLLTIAVVVGACGGTGGVSIRQTGRRSRRSPPRVRQRARRHPARQ